MVAIDYHSTSFEKVKFAFNDNQISAINNIDLTLQINNILLMEFTFNDFCH